MCLEHTGEAGGGGVFELAQSRCRGVHPALKGCGAGNEDGDRRLAGVERQLDGHVGAPVHDALPAGESDRDRRGAMVVPLFEDLPQYDTTVVLGERRCRGVFSGHNQRRPKHPQHGLHGGDAR